MGSPAGTTTRLLLWLCVSVGCGGRSDEASSCAALCEVHQGCGYEVTTCTERCESTLQEYPCEQERRALLRCVQALPPEAVECDEAGSYSSFSPRDPNSGPCHEQDVASTQCDCAANPLIECF